MLPFFTQELCHASVQVAFHLLRCRIGGVLEPHSFNLWSGHARCVWQAGGAGVAMDNSYGEVRLLWERTTPRVERRDQRSNRVPNKAFVCSRRHERDKVGSSTSAGWSNMAP
jgi:hypothetical protein